MAYDNSTDTTTYSTPSTGEFTNVKEMDSLGEVYVLPTGDIWQGDVHQMSDGLYMTGSVHTAASIPVIKVFDSPEFPAKNLVAKKTIFDQVFNKIVSWSTISEGGLGTINSKLTSLNETINDLTTVLNLAFDKIEDYIERVNIQSETNGTGVIMDNEIHYSLDAESSKDYSNLISSVEYIHNNDNNVYIFNGNVSSGLSNEGIQDILNRQIKLDMVSRTGAVLDITEIENILLVDDSYEFGFDGIIKITLSSPATISSIKLPTNGTINSVSIDGGETWISNFESFKTISVSSILISISYTSPVPFDSYITNDLSEDLLGNPQIDQYLLSPSVYQRTSLDVGKLKLSSVNYQEEKSFESGPYHLKSGYLKSITLSAVEELEDETEYSNYFEYKIVIGGQEYPITPWTRSGPNPQIYYINSSLSNGSREALASQGIGFIDTNLPEVSFSLKTKLIRPELNYITPIVKGFTFNYATTLSGGVNG